MSSPKIVRQTPVKHGDEWALTVSTVQAARNDYRTVVFDDTDDKRHVGWKIGDYVIEHTSERAATRDEAMDQHREALYEVRTGSPKAPEPPTGPRHDWDETPAEAARYDRHHFDRDED
jgi:hypothetical protein